MAKPFSGAGAWALDAEREEAELRALSSPPPPLLAGATPLSFPSLHDAAAVKSKHKKPIPISLSKFIAPKPQTLTLPTGPSQRAEPELDSIGFRSYAPRFDKPTPTRADYDVGGLSRADEAENWAAGKKSFAQPSPRGDRYDSYGGGTRSRADEVANWNIGKKMPLPPLGVRWRLIGDPMERIDAGIAVSWRRGTVFGDARPREEVLKEKGIDVSKIDAEIEARRVSRLSSYDSSESVGSESTRQRVNPFGNAKPREVVLKEKGKDVSVIDGEIEARRMSNPSSSYSWSDGGGLNAGAVGGEGGDKLRRKVNPFGDAKPREVVLREKGIDWRKVDLELEHRSIDRPESPEEKLLKEDINLLKGLLKEIKGSLNNESTGYPASLHKQILTKEADLELLRRQLDDKVRYGQRLPGGSRPGSASARSATYSDRPLSRSGRSGEFIDMPRSRGSVGGSWATEGGFFTDKNMDTPRSRGSVGEDCVWERGLLMDRNMESMRVLGRIGEGCSRERAFLTDRNMDRRTSRPTR